MSNFPNELIQDYWTNGNGDCLAKWLLDNWTHDQIILFRRKFGPISLYNDTHTYEEVKKRFYGVSNYGD